MSLATTKALAMNNEDNIPDTTLPEYLTRKKTNEEFLARLRKVLIESGIPEATKPDDDAQEDDSYTISFSNGMEKQTREPED